MYKDDTSDQLPAWGASSNAGASDKEPGLLQLW